MGFNTKKEKRAKYDFYDFSLFLCRNGSRHRNRVCRHECGSCDQSDADHFSWHGSVSGSRYRTCQRCARQCGLSLYLRQKQKPGCGKRNRDDGHGTFIYAGGQLYRKSAPEYDHGRIFDGHDTAAWCQIYRKTGYDDQRSHAGSLKKEAFYPVCDLRHADRIYLRLCRSGRRTDDASDPDKCAWL